ncbi:flagellar basal body rod protein FlgC [bacterium]|nr:flagellar basal body rod protein FlgC [bacterium]
MDLFTAFRVSYDGLSSQRTRLNTVASNLANVNTTRTAEGGAFRKKSPVFESQPLEEIFESENEDSMEIKMEDEDENFHDKVSTVKIDSIESSDRVRVVYEPSHPDANADGYVSYPDIDPVMEMVDLISTSRSYEANVSVIDAIKKMATQAISISK